MSYAVKEIFYSLQGEGAQTGRAAVFCRFSGCNLWSGQERDRFKSICQFCDTDFVGIDGGGGGKFRTAEQLARAVRTVWPKEATEGRPFVVCTGGEPMLQLDESLTSAFHDLGFEIAVETNGTCWPVPGIDWICVSPKAGADLILSSGHELKLIYPQVGAEPERYEKLSFERFYLQPMDGPELARNTELAIAYIMQHPNWRLSLQTHKSLGLR